MGWNERRRRKDKGDRRWKLRFRNEGKGNRERSLILLRNVVIREGNNEKGW